MRLVQVGLGLWGLNWATEILPQVPGANTVAFVEASAAARQRAIEAGIAADLLYADLDQAIAAKSPEAVLATVPLSAHVPLCRQALIAGLHVLVEKPFAETVDEARQLVGLAGSRGRILAINQNYRYFAHALAARRLVADGQIGTPQAIRLTFTRLFDEGYRYFFLDQPLLSDMAIHHFDLMRFILDDEPVSVSCQAWGEEGMPFAGPPAAAAIIRFAKGTIVHYFGSWISRGPDTPYGGHWEIDGSAGRAVFAFRGDKRARHGQDRFDLHEGQGVSPIKPDALDLTDRAGVLNAFAAAVDHGRYDPHLSLVDDNVRSLALMEAAILSANKDGQLVAIAA